MKLGIKRPSLTILPDYTDAKEKLPKREGGHKLWPLFLLPFPTASTHCSDTKSHSLMQPTIHSTRPFYLGVLQRSKHLPALTNLLTQVLRHGVGDARVHPETHISHTGKERPWGGDCRSHQPLPQRPEPLTRSTAPRGCTLAGSTLADPFG